MEISEEDAKQILGLITNGMGYASHLPDAYTSICNRIFAAFPQLKEPWSSLTPEEQQKLVTPNNIQVGKIYVVWYPYDEEHKLDAREGHKTATYEGVSSNYCYDYDYGDQYVFKDVKSDRQYHVAEENLSRFVVNKE